MQQLLVQRQAKQEQAGAGQPPAKAKEPAEVGEIKIEKPKIEYYEVSGDNLPQVTNQLLPPGKWYEYQYQYKPKFENGVVTRIDIVVVVTLRLPRWVGQGWQHATDADKADWLKLLETMQGKEDEYQDITELPSQWLLGPGWKQAPEQVKKEWQAMLLKSQTEERSYLDIARRRALVLQQRMFHQPADMILAIFDKFMKDLKIEQEKYIAQMKPGQPQPVSLGADVIVQ
jgi:hypothetical protein